MIAVIDYGLGNLKSVHKAFKLLGYESKITTNRKQILDSQAIVFPGVGSFGDCMNELDGRNLISVPEVLELPFSFKGETESPFLNSI